jgi:hypothetical protein
VGQVIRQGQVLYTTDLTDLTVIISHACAGEEMPRV